MKVSPRQLEQWIQDLEDGCVSASDHERLLATLAEDQRARRLYCEHMAFSSAMHMKAEAEADLFREFGFRLGEEEHDRD